MAATASGQHQQASDSEQNTKVANVNELPDVQPTVSTESQSDEQDGEAFPWHIGIFDAHCHPTDSMHAIPQLDSMNAQVLTIMATRFQDQDLVARVAAQYAYNSQENSRASNLKPRGAKVIPSFGYHPWFSHLIYDDLEDPTQKPPDRLTHYNNVLTASPVAEDLPASLPEPVSLSKILDETRANLQACPHALLGEVGLDRTFRIPHGATWRSEDPDSEAKTIERAAGLTAGTHHAHPLTKHRVKPAHQIRIMQAQLSLAGELNRAASVHVVGGQGAAFDAMRELWRGFEVEVQSAREKKIMWRKKGDPVVVEEDQDENEKVERTKPFPPRICLHSFSGPPETIKQYLHATIPVDFYFSFSEVINFSLPQHQRQCETDTEVEPSLLKALAALKAVPDDRLLIESDLHICGTRMDGLLEDVVRRVCEARGWGLTDGTRRLKENWIRFVFGISKD